MAEGVSQKDEMDTTVPFDVFISYAHNDETQFGYAAELAAALEAAGISVWYDKELMDDSGTDWHGAITHKMEEASVIVALWSKTALSRPMCRYEATYASGKDKLLPVALEDIVPEDFTEELKGLTYRLNQVKWDVPSLVSQVETRLQQVADAEARRALRRKLAPRPPTEALLAQQRVELPAVLTSGSGFLAGRDTEESLLLDAWNSCAPEADAAGKTHILVLHAIGGAGKTALMRRLVDRLAETDFPHAEKVLGWSAYSQGSGENRNADSENFIIDALRFMGELGELPGDAIARARLLAAKLKETRTLLLLDGIEPLQSLPDVDRGRLKDKGLQRLIQDLALGHPGLVVITSRQHLPELENRNEPAVRSRALDSLSPRAGAHLLRHLGCWGANDDMQTAVEEVQGHALSVTLLGTFIDAVEAGDIARRDHLGLQDIVDTPEELAASEQTARLAKRAGAIMEGYITRFEALETSSKGRGEMERMLLSIVGLFDRPADGGAVRALLEGEPIPGLTDVWHAASPAQRDQRLRVAKSRLRELKLLGSEDEADPGALDAHPVVRSHFGKALQQTSPDTWRAAHERLYRHYQAVPEKELPDKLAEMQPLFHAINHGCKAGQVQEAWDEVYQGRVRRRNEAFIIHQLGAYAANLGALAHFFDPPWAAPSEAFERGNSRAAALGYAAFALRALGRLTEAEAPTAAAVELEIQEERWKNAAIAASNLSELRLAIGRVVAAVEAGEEAVAYADRSSDGFWTMASRTTLADALAQAGQGPAAAALFAEAEARQAKNEPRLPRLYSLQGYRYCDLLLARGAAQAVRERAAYALQVSQRNNWLLNIGLDTLAGARTLALLTAHGTPEAGEAAGPRLDEAVSALRTAGQDIYLAQGLLARAEFRRQAFERGGDAANLKTAAEDLAETHDIASRGSMGLFLTDWHLESARLCLAQIPGAPPEALVPLVGGEPGPDDPWLEAVRPQPPGAEPVRRSILARIFSGKSAPAPAAVWRSDPLTPDEKQLLDTAEAHYTDAFARVQETGYHRRDRDLKDLRARLDELRALG